MAMHWRASCTATGQSTSGRKGASEESRDLQECERTLDVGESGADDARESRD